MFIKQDKYRDTIIDYISSEVNNELYASNNIRINDIKQYDTIYDHTAEPYETAENIKYLCFLFPKTKFIVSITSVSCTELVPPNYCLFQATHQQSSNIVPNGNSWQINPRTNNIFLNVIITSKANIEYIEDQEVFKNSYTRENFTELFLQSSARHYLRIYSEDSDNSADAKAYFTRATKKTNTYTVFTNKFDGIIYHKLLIALAAYLKREYAEEDYNWPEGVDDIFNNFIEKPITPESVAFCFYDIAVLCGDLVNYQENKIKNIIKRLETNIFEKTRTSLQNTITNTNTSINAKLREINDYQQVLIATTQRLNGLLTEPEIKISDVLQGNRAITKIEPWSDDTLLISMRVPVVNIDYDMVTRRSHKNGWMSEYETQVKQLVESLFVEQNYTIISQYRFRLTFTNGVITLGYTNDNDAFNDQAYYSAMRVIDGYLPNWHLTRFHCLGNGASELAKYATVEKLENYLNALTAIVANYNFGDYVVTQKLFNNIRLLYKLYKESPNDALLDTKAIIVDCDDKKTISYREWIHNVTGEQENVQNMVY